jgi:hypothetical protein
MKSTIQSVLQSALPLLALVYGAGCAAEEPRGVQSEHYAGDAADPNPELHTGTIATPAGTREIRYEVIDNLAIIDGDLVIPSSDFIDPHVAHATTTSRDGRWPNRVVPYEIDASASGSSQAIQATLNAWSSRVGISFVSHTTQPDYVRFVGSNGYASYVGRIGGMQQIWLAGADQGAITHEVGHALGLWHEQQRQIRGYFVQIHWQNIQAGAELNFQEVSSMGVGDYDFGSIMHYNSYAFSANGQPTITTVYGDLISGQRDTISGGDALGVRVLYADPGAGDDLASNETLAPNTSITSSNGQYRLACQTDGNFVLYRTSNGAALWGLPITGAVSPGACIMQSDGNLVVYSGAGSPTWSSGTGGSGHRLVVQNDGNVVMYRPNGTSVWSTNTMQYPSGPAATGFDMYPGETLSPGQWLLSSNGQFQLVYQNDGNLVLYRTSDGNVRWATNTNGTVPGVLIMQTDGNLVLYRGTGGAIWSSGTNTGGSHFDVQTDGNLVIYRPNGTPAWALW